MFSSTFVVLALSASALANVFVRNSNIYLFILGGDVEIRDLLFSVVGYSPGLFDYVHCR